MRVDPVRVARVDELGDGRVAVAVELRRLGVRDWVRLGLFGRVLYTVVAVDVSGAASSVAVGVDRPGKL
jgi:hypothetical protein